MQIIDSHLHFWNPALLRYAWLDNEPPINRPFVAADFQEAVESLDVKALVFVQADCLPEQSLDEVQWVSGLAAEIPIRGIVAFAPLDRGDAARSVLAALAEYPLVKGVRRLIQSEGPGFATQPDFIRGVQLLPEYGFSFDLCIRHYQLQDVIQLVSRCPEVAFVLDHIGKPAIAAGDIAQWQADIAALAAYPHVQCKLSGMITEASHTTWTIDDLRPYANHVLDVFGSDRVMFGSDWPVCRLASSYQHWVNTAQQLVAHLPADEQQRIFSQNALRFYRLEI